MQLIPRYLVKNRVNVISNTAGLVVEYRPVYQRTIRITRGIDNTVQFRLLNADQKPQVITGTPVFVAFDDQLEKIFELPCAVLDDGSSISTRGLFAVTITDNDLLNVPQQYLKYNVYILDNTGKKNITYGSTDFSSSGVMFVDSMSYPAPVPSKELTEFFKIGDSWYASSNTIDNITVVPELANSNGIHTVAIFPGTYTGSVTVEGTLDNTVGLNWFDIISTDVTANNNSVLTFQGSYTYIRIKLETDPSDTGIRIVIRN